MTSLFFKSCNLPSRRARLLGKGGADLSFASFVFVRTALLGWCFSSLLFGCSDAHSQQTLQTIGSTPLRLSLQDAVESALKQNIDVQISNLDTASAQQEKKLSRAALLPEASLQASDLIQRYNLEALIGLQFAGFPKNVGPYQSLHAGPRFSSPLFDLSLVRRYQADGHREAASREDARSTREQTVLLTVSQYVAQLRAMADVRAAQSRVELAERLYKQAEALEADGVATKIDVARAAVSLLNQKQRLSDAQSQVETTMFGLQRILNIPGTQEIILTDTSLFDQTPDLAIPTTVDLALLRRPELASLAQTVRAAEKDHQAAVASSLPTLGVNGGWNQQGRTLGNVYPGYDYTITFTVPLISGGRLTANRKLAELDVQRTQHQLQEARNRVAEQVRDGEVELRSSRSDVELGREQVRLAQQEVELAQGRFSAGVTDNIEVTTAQDELARANDTEITALYRFNIARANLARAVGSIEAVYSVPTGSIHP